MRMLVVAFGEGQSADRVREAWSVVAMSLSLRSARTRSAPAPAYHHDRPLEEQVQRQAEHGRAHEVASGCRDRGEDRDRQDDDPARSAKAIEVTIPTRDRPTSRIGNSIRRAKARNIVVTKSKYSRAVRSGFNSGVWKDSRKAVANGQDDVGDRRRRSRRRRAQPESRAGSPGVPSGQAGGDEAPELPQDHRHPQDDAGDQRDPDPDRERDRRRRSCTAAGRWAAACSGRR